jgi:Putative Actinobacterial Holin-X, holin superfamily III
VADKGARKGVRESGTDAFQLTIDYVKQETVGPLKKVGRYLIYGIAAAFLLAIGFIFILLGVLRLLQDQTGTALTGDWSWVPYLITAALGIVILAIAAWRINAGAKPKLPPTTTDAPGGTN